MAVKLARPHGQRRQKYGTLIPTAIIGLPGRVVSEPSIMFSRCCHGWCGRRIIFTWTRMAGLLPARL